MTASTRPSSRTAHWLMGGLLAAGFSFVALVGGTAPASAVACQGCVVVSAPTIGLNATAQPGLQAVIDQQGGVAVYTPLTTGTVGGLGTVWLVGHRTTHGSVFNLVPSLQAGDYIDLIDDAGVHRYIVNRLLVVSESGFRNDVDINDMSRSMLILQTSHPDSHLRYLIEAFGAGLVPPDAAAAAPAPAETVPAETVPATSPATIASTIPATGVPVATTPIINKLIPSPAPAVRTSKFGAIKSVV